MEVDKKTSGEGVSASSQETLSTTLDLALEGERLCKAGDFYSGIAFLEAAVESGTDDLKTLSAIYSQLGNAYFFIGNYNKAVSFHKNDLTVARTLGDRSGEGKASGNLGNTLKVIGRFDEGILCCRRHLDISTQIKDEQGRSRALYNLANVYHAKAKSILKNSSNFSSINTNSRGTSDVTGAFPENASLPREAVQCLEQAVSLYRQTLTATQSLKDKQNEGRAAGNLGNVYYLLGDFKNAINYHKLRLDLACEFDDKQGMRRAHTNLGNSFVFNGDFEIAIDHYRTALELSKLLADPTLEAQSCYSLGNTYTLMREYEKAIDFHLKHLHIAEALGDKLGSSRSHWSLGNAYASLGNNKEALCHAKKHLELSKDLNDPEGLAIASMNCRDIQFVVSNSIRQSQMEQRDSLGGNGGVPSAGDLVGYEVRNSPRNSIPSSSATSTPKSHLKYSKEMLISDYTGNFKSARLRRSSMDEMKVLNTPEVKLLGTGSTNKKPAKLPSKPVEQSNEDFFDMLSRLQGDRLDEQRCVLGERKEKSKSNLGKMSKKEKMSRANSLPSSSFKVHKKNLKEESSSNKENISSSGKCRRANSIVSTHELSVCPSTEEMDNEDLFELIWGLQCNRMDEQRADLPDKMQSGTSKGNVAALEDEEDSVEDFFENIIRRIQSTRIEDQRSELPPLTGVSTQVLPTAPDRSWMREHQQPNPVPRSSTSTSVLDEEFIQLIARVAQQGRMDDQRANIRDRNSNHIVQNPDDHRQFGRN